MKLFIILLPLLITACSNPNKDCLDADMFGHCNHWKGQPVSCKERSILLGLCKKDKMVKPSAKTKK